MYKIFEQLLQKNNVTPYKVSRATGIATSTLSDWKNGKSAPKQDKLQKIADYFNVSVDYLMGREEKTSESLSFAKDRFKALINEYQDEAIKMIAKLCKSERIEKDLTEKNVSTNSNVDLEEYLAFENDFKNIGTDNMISVLAFFDINLSYIAGFLTGTLVKAKNDDDVNALLDRLLLSGDIKKEIAPMIIEKSEYLESIDKKDSELPMSDDDLITFRNKLKKVMEIIDDNLI